MGIVVVEFLVIFYGVICDVYDQLGSKPLTESS